MALPTDYAQGDKSYPVLYLLDANLHFGLVTSITTTHLLERHFESRETVPEMLVIGIGYPLELGFPTRINLRKRHLTPPEDRETFESKQNGLFRDLEHQGSGQAADFLKFIRDELIPFVDSHYRTNPADKTIAGYSLSGLFALYELFHHPTMFSRYIVTSPSVEYGDGVTFAYERAYTEKHSELPVKLFLSVGAMEEDLKMYKKFVEILEARNYAGLELESVIFEDEDHFTVIYPSLCHGFRSIFKK